MIRKLLLTLALVGGFIAPALAQSVTLDTMSGNEAWNVGQGPGGPSSFLTSNVVRNSPSALAATIAGATTIGTTSGFTSLRWGGNLLVTAQPAAAVITLPPNPFPHGGVVGYCNVTNAAFAANAVTVAANSNQTLAVAATLTTQAAGTCALFQFNRPTTTWYRIS